MSIAESRCAHLLFAAVIVGLISMAPTASTAQAPPAPPPTPDAIQSDDSRNEASRTDDGTRGDASDDEATSEEDEDGSLPAPPSIGELEGQPAPDGADGEDSEAPERQLSPSKQYDNQYLQIGRTSGDPIAPMLRYGSPMISKRGTFGSIVDPLDFYQKIGRPDLARKFKRRSAARTIVLATSAVTATVVPYVLFTAGSAIDPFCTANCTPAQQRQEQTMNTLYIMAGASFVAGSAALIGSIFWSVHPVSVAERRALADEYNQSLREKLGISSSERTPPVEIQFGASPIEDGAVGVFTLTF